jgi:hypothetical protein
MRGSQPIEGKLGRELEVAQTSVCDLIEENYRLKSVPLDNRVCATIGYLNL